MPAYAPMAYRGHAACGCVVGLAVDDGTQPADTAEFVAEMIRSGGWVERVTIAEARTSDWGHRCGRQAAQEQLPGLEG